MFSFVPRRAQTHKAFYLLFSIAFCFVGHEAEPKGPPPRPPPPTPFRCWWVTRRRHLAAQDLSIYFVARHTLVNLATARPTALCGVCLYSAHYRPIKRFTYKDKFEAREFIGLLGRGEIHRHERDREMEKDFYFILLLEIRSTDGGARLGCLSLTSFAEAKRRPPSWNQDNF